MKNISLISTSYPDRVNGWQGLFIARIVEGLAEIEDINLELWSPDGNRPENCTYLCSDKEKEWLDRMLQRGGISQLLRSAPLNSIPYIYKIMTALYGLYHNHQTDIFHINWLQNSLALSGTDTPAIITVLGNDFPLLKLPGMKAMLRHVFSQRKAIICPNSFWMAEKLDEHFGNLASIQPVPFGVDQKWFDIERTETERNTWIVVSRITAKKMGTLFDWSKALGSDHQIHLFGPNVENLKIPNHITYHGPAQPKELYENWFPTATGLISLSQHNEGLPQVILEAMASGIPVIASDLPAHNDVVINDETGRIVKDEDNFKFAVKKLSDTAENSYHGAMCRQFIKTNFGTWQDCSQRYNQLYNTLI